MLQRARALLLFFLKVNIERNVRAYLYNWECVCGGGGGGDFRDKNFASCFL